MSGVPASEISATAAPSAMRAEKLRPRGLRIMLVIGVSAVAMP